MSKTRLCYDCLAGWEAFSKVFCVFSWILEFFGNSKVVGCYFDVVSSLESAKRRVTLPQVKLCFFSPSFEVHVGSAMKQSVSLQ